LRYAVSLRCIRHAKIRPSAARLSFAGRLVHALDSGYPLHRAAAAHARDESGQAIGNVASDID
jgi:hypothetical protein